MKRVLSIDPGITTGIAIYDENGELETSLTATKKAIFKSGFLNKLVDMSQPEVVLLENIPIQNVNQEMFDLYAYVRRWFITASYNLVDIKPSQWKNLVTRVEIPGQHARDAATMGKWWIDNQ